MTTAHPDLDLSAEVADALAAGKPVVALESTSVAHGMPRPDNLAAGQALETAVRAAGAKPLVCLKIENDDFMALVNEFPSMGLEIMRELARRIVKTNAQLRNAMAARA